MIPSIPSEDFWMLKMVLWVLPQTQLALQLWPLPSCKIYNSSKPCIISGYNGTYITRENNIHVSNIYGVRGPLLQTCRNQLPNWHLLAQDSSLWAGSKNHFFIRRSPYSWFQKKMLAVVNQSGNQRKKPKEKKPKSMGIWPWGFHLRDLGESWAPTMLWESLETYISLCIYARVKSPGRMGNRHWKPL